MAERLRQLRGCRHVRAVSPHVHASIPSTRPSRPFVYSSTRLLQPHTPQKESATRTAGRGSDIRFLVQRFNKPPWPRAGFRPRRRYGRFDVSPPPTGVAALSALFGYGG